MPVYDVTESVCRRVKI